MLKLKLQNFGHLMQRTDSYWKRPWCRKRLKAGEGENRRWDGWMASLTRWTWVSASSRNWWWTGKPGVLQSMGSHRVRHDWAAELNRKSEKSFLTGQWKVTRSKVEETGPVTTTVNRTHIWVHILFSPLPCANLQEVLSKASNPSHMRDPIPSSLLNHNLSGAKSLLLTESRFPSLKITPRQHIRVLLLLY